MPQERPLVCLVDSSDDGHHPMYAAVYARAFCELGCDVWLVAPADMIAAMPSVDELSDAAGGITPMPWSPPAQPQSGPIRFGQLVSRRWEALSGVLDQASLAAGRYPDLLLLLWFDDFIDEILPRRAVESRIRCPFAGLWFQPPPRRPRTWRQRVKRLLRVGRRYSVLRSPQCAGVLLLDATGAGHLSQLGCPRLLEVPEVSVSRLPESEPDVVAEIRRRAGGRSIFSVVGALEWRKGLGPFLQAAAVAPADEWFFVMAGRVQNGAFDENAAELRDAMTAGVNPRLLLIDRWLDDETLNAIVACSSLVHVCYFDWLYSSNMICKAAACDVPAIGGIAGYIGRMIRDYHLGFTVKTAADLSAQFVPGFAAEVAALQGSAAFRDGCRRYRADNNPAVLKDVLARLLNGCRSLNLSAADRDFAGARHASKESPLHAG